MRNILLEVFKENGWQYTQPIDSQELYVVAVTASNGTLQCYAEIDETLNRFRFYAHYGSNIPAESRIRVAELLTRLNYGLYVGNLEMNIDSGEVRFKTSFSDPTGNPPAKSAMSFLVLMSIVSMDLASPGITKVMLDSLTPEEAYLEISTPTTSQETPTAHEKSTE
jgi:hypothetical protein